MNNEEAVKVFIFTNAPAVIYKTSCKNIFISVLRCSSIGMLHLSVIRSCRSTHLFVNAEVFPGSSLLSADVLVQLE